MTHTLNVFWLDVVEYLCLIGIYGLMKDIEKLKIRMHLYLHSTPSSTLARPTEGDSTSQVAAIDPSSHSSSLQGFECNILF